MPKFEHSPFTEAHIYCATEMVEKNFSVNEATPPWLKELSKKLREEPEVQLTDQDVALALKEG
jgi:hypothetical protein